MRAILGALLDFALPPLCLLCGDEIGGGELGLGIACLRRLHRIDPRQPRCELCGRPSPIGYAGGRCPDCAARPPAFARAASAALYAGAARELVLRFKLHADRSAGAALESLLLDAVASLRVASDVVVPVPSHRLRDRRRRLRPARELAEGVADRLALPCRSRWIERRRYSPPQGDPGTTSRRANVKDAFAETLRPAWTRPRTPDGLRVLLVDDVLTSGATAHECARALRRAGAREVVVATVARGGLGPDALLSARETPAPSADAEVGAPA